MRTVRVVGAALVALLALVVYANTLLNGLHVDDQQQIVDNPWIRDPTALGEIFTSGVWDHAGRVSSYYRPGMFLLYMGTFLLFGLQPWAFHLLNVTLHVGASVLVYLIVWRLSFQNQDPHADPDQGKQSLVAMPSLAAGALFATHPIHTESVAWAAGVTDVSFSLFFLLALYLYINSRQTWISIIASAVAFFAALLCKEPAITLPVVLVAYDLFLRREKFSLGRCALRQVPYVAAIAIYMVLRVQALGGFAPVSTEASFTLYHYVINVMALFSRYLEALVLPLNLNFWHIFRPVTSLASPTGIKSILVVSAFLGLALLAWRKSRAALFGLTLLVVPLLPSFHVSALNQGLENAFAERYLYLPSVGFVIVIAAFLAWVSINRPQWRRLLIVMVAVVVVAYSVTTIRRNVVWKDAFSLWSDAISKSPQSAVVQMNYGFSLIGRGEVSAGREHLEKARELDPARVDLKIQNGIAYAGRGNIKQAILELSAALELDPQSVMAHYNIAILFEKLGWMDEAIQHYEKALALAPDFADAHNNLGILFAEDGDLVNAGLHFETAVRLDSTHPEYRANLERLRSLEGR